MKPNGIGLTRLRNAFRCSVDGIRYAYQHEAAFRQELLVSAILVPLAFFVTANPVELALLIGPLILVLMVECINSAIEATIDRISLAHHHLSKHAKDLGSAAVMLCMILLVMNWLLIVFF